LLAVVTEIADRSRSTPATRRRYGQTASSTALVSPRTGNPPSSIATIGDAEHLVESAPPVRLAIAWRSAIAEDRIARLNDAAACALQQTSVKDS
jgi:hypothetical protein